MYKITNIDTLGTEYTVANKDGKILKHVRVLQHTEKLDAVLGEYDHTVEDMASYLERAASALSGNEDIKEHSIYWLTTEAGWSMHDVIEHAVTYSYDVVVIELVSTEQIIA